MPVFFFIRLEIVQLHSFFFFQQLVVTVSVPFRMEQRHLQTSFTNTLMLLKCTLFPFIKVKIAVIGGD